MKAATWIEGRPTKPADAYPMWQRRVAVASFSGWIFGYSPEGGAACSYCWRPVAIIREHVAPGRPLAHFDHVKPRIQGGGDSMANLVPACPSCNLSKGRHTPREWATRLGLDTLDRESPDRERFPGLMLLFIAPRAGQLRFIRAAEQLRSEIWGTAEGSEEPAPRPMSRSL